jgi:hypothetical protein
MPSEQNYRNSRRPQPHIVSIADERKEPHYDVLTIGIYILAGAIVALGLANLPAWTGSLLGALNVLPSHLS